MIELTKAIEIADHFVSIAYSDRGKIEPRFEEIELSSDKNYWLVTIRFISDPGMGGSVVYSYTVVQIDANDGTVVSAKNKKY